MCRDRVGQYSELSRCELWDQTWAAPSTPLGCSYTYTMALQPGPRFQQIGDRDGDGGLGASPMPDKSGTGTGERPRPRANRGRTPRPRPRTNRGRGRGRGPGCPRPGKKQGLVAELPPKLARAPAGRGNFGPSDGGTLSTQGTHSTLGTQGTPKVPQKHKLNQIK